MLENKQESLKERTALREEPIATKNDKLADLALRLALSYKEVRIMPGDDMLLRYLDIYEKRITEAFQYFQQITSDKLILSYASEWILDNYYVIRQSFRQIRQDLPPGYDQKLPRLVQPPFKNYPRVYGIAHSLAEFSQLKIELDDTELVLQTFQGTTPLTMGEIWAVPIFLRYLILETLAKTLDKIISPDKKANDLTPSVEVTINLEDVVANCVMSLRDISNQDWNAFFEHVSLVNRILAGDPSGIYEQMDFNTRDLYRKAVEKIAASTHQGENQVAEAAVALARQYIIDREAHKNNNDSGYTPDRQSHVGYYLISAGQSELEIKLSGLPGLWERIKAWISNHPTPFYLGSILVIVGLILFFTASYLLHASDNTWIFWVGSLILIVPAFTMAVSLVNWVVTLLIPPQALPKLELGESIPPSFQTMIVIPALLTNKEEFDSLARQVEMHYLRNPESGLFFAIVTDFGDAPNEHMPEDQALLDRAIASTHALNEKYGRSIGRTPFYFLHRKRVWNPSEGVWMGWERKRGKLHELNLLLRGREGLTFSTVYGDSERLPQVNFIITLDADTILPRGAASRMIGTLAHPLNRVSFAGNSNKVIDGYTILQPRIEIGPTSSNQSWFTRIFSGENGLDLYTLAVSDPYQDLFREGIYVGKGIYDIDAFERSTAGQIPENSLLSHDLLEGILGRAGLVTDITLVEDYPPHYLILARRQHRWIRGDWQLLPWLFGRNLKGGKFSGIDRWKIFDNLRRSLVMPSLLLLLVLGWIYFPGSRLLWTLLPLSVLGIPVITSGIQGTIQGMSRNGSQTNFRPVGLAALRWLLSIVFLPYEAYISLDAILVTLYRLLISHRKMLEWTSAAHTIRSFRKQNTEQGIWQEMNGTLVVVNAVLIWIILKNPAALPIAAPILFAWLVSPEVVRRISLPIEEQTVRLTEEQEQLLRTIARRTWAFFEQFVGPEDHWLPPDHFQESPLGMVGHRTSPTNIGLLLTSTLAAQDLGYLDQFNFITRLRATFDNLEKLERFRGHFLNWYDTRSLQPLSQRYVSTVDSGNLAAGLIVTAQACRQMQSVRIFRWQWWLGYLDTLKMLEEAIVGLKGEEVEVLTARLSKKIDQLRADILSVKDNTHGWYGLFRRIVEQEWPEISQILTEIVQTGSESLSQAILRGLLEVAKQVEIYHNGAGRTIQELTPWIPMFQNVPKALLTMFSSAEQQGDLDLLMRNLPSNPELGRISQMTRDQIVEIQKMKAIIDQHDSTSEEIGQAKQWLDELTNKLNNAAASANLLLSGYYQLASEADRYVQAMDFEFLYDPDRRVFHIGYNLDTTQLDNNYYDLLASEARIASIIAISKGDVPQQHWLHLNRPVTLIDRKRVLLSWSATMFEYIMPPLFLKSYPGTLLHESSQGAVDHQIEYGLSKGDLWGISESGFYRFDANQNYQYRAFGVPGLGFKRGLEDDHVIAPYASLMAINFNPLNVYVNAKNLIKYHLLGLYGFYEAIDFTQDRLTLGQKYAVVYSYMAHHQGMVLLALDNYFNNHIMVERMHSNVRIKSVEILLQEQIPYHAPLQNPESEEVSGLQRLSTAPTEISPWTVPIYTPIPQVHLLSNGSLNSIISNSGSGFIQWQNIDLLRWRADATLDPWGLWIYMQDLEEKSEEGLWSIGNQPIPGESAELQVTSFPHKSSFRRYQNEIAAVMEVFVPPDDSVEIRRIQVSNTSNRRRRLRLTSYGEVILNSQETDIRHPAFNKLFIESEYLPDLNMLIFWRRPRSATENSVFLGHMLVIEDGRGITGAFETDRSRFIGRGQDYRRPAALFSPGYLTETIGATLDPIFSIGQELTISPHEGVNLAYLTFAAATREEVIALAHRYREWNMLERSLRQANISSESRMREQAITSENVATIEEMLSALLYPYKQVRAAPEILVKNTLGQSGLWPYGISGDNPIILVSINHPVKLELIREVLQAHRYWRERRLMVDLVILNEQQVNYGAELNSLLYRLINHTNSDNWLNQRGGVYILYGSQIKPEEQILLRTVARVVLDGDRGSLKEQLADYFMQVPHLPAFNPSRLVSEIVEDTPPLQEMGELLFQNGYGGFSKDGKEYVIELKPGQWTPSPWVNVIGYPQFGFLVSESGSSCTWSVNSGENRLSAWLNDPVTDPSGEAMYLRDEETGEIWSPTPLPGGDDAPYRVRHGAGYTIFEHNSNGLIQRLQVFASPTDPVKIIKLKVENTWNRQRRITVTQYVGWVLGTAREASQQYVLSDYDIGHETLLATNAYNTEFKERAAFLAASKSIHGLTADRTEYLGRNGMRKDPVGLRRIGPETRITAGEDPCGVLQLHIDLAPGQSEEVYFLLGEGDNRQHALDLVEQYHQLEKVDQTWQQVQQFWDDILGKIQVTTPDPANDLILNRWLLYQTLSCRIWGRSGFYQSSGAFGYRDQLQDVMALLPVKSEIARSHILLAASYQFEEGDVLHWWHPPFGRGVRTRISDDLLWLPYVTSEYIMVTGDSEILDEKVPFLKGDVLKPGEEERYDLYRHTDEPYSLLEHCLRAIKKGTTSGPQNLPLIGTGDWNDGLNRVGIEGKGESVWLGWFLYDVLNRFAKVLDLKQQPNQAEPLRKQAALLAERIEATSWDGNWYKRAYYDNGTPLGSSTSFECKIDSIAQSWAIISGAANPQHGRQAMQSVLDLLVHSDNRLILLFTPPFDKTQRDPGYIKGYVPGIRENGGQYTHASTWTSWAFARLGEGNQAWKLYQLLNPIFQNDSAEKAERYQVEPYVIAADIYSTPPHVRRGGWTWYTGSAGWMYRLGLEEILGFHLLGNQLRINPVIPAEWDSFEIRYKAEGSDYLINVENPEHVEQGVVEIRMGDQLLSDNLIPLTSDGNHHTVKVIMGKAKG